MAGGTYISHTDLEVTLGYGAAGLTSTSEPITDGQVDNICVMVEGVADAYIRSKTRRTLANANTANAAACKGALQAIAVEHCKTIMGARTGTQSRGGRGGGTETFWDRADIRVYLDSLAGLAASGATVMTYGHVVQSGKTHLGT